MTLLTYNKIEAVGLFIIAVLTYLQIAGWEI